MEEGIGEVVFEKRNHATRPFSSDSFQQQVMEGIGGGSMSFLPGINQIKEKWREYRRPKISTKLVSLFVSTGGEYVAVAAGNEITFLGRDDNYTVPCGIFTSKDRLTTFRHGAWSDTHGVLGVIDSMDTLYLLKFNGEEISRKSKRQLRLPASLLGLISFQHPNIKGSVLCSFHILTSDGLLHHVEVSKDPRALTSSGQILENHLALQRHFPQNVSCMDFHPQLYLLALVGCGASENSRNVSGSYCLSLWRVTGNLELELLSCSPQLEGQFYDPRSYMGASSTPKVLFSSLGKYLAVLDVSENLDIFSLDAELHSLSPITFSERCYSQRGDKFLPGSRRCLHDIVDFTWWCDHIIVLVKKTGAIIMLDIESGTKLLETHKEFSMPVVERVQQSQGCVFILENRLSSDYRGTTGMHDTETANCDIYNLHNISTLHWSLMSFIERSASEMYTILITNRQFPAALDFANRHGLDKDLVFKAQWLQSDQGTIEIKMFLSNIKDQDFVLSECVNKGGPTEDVVKILIAYGLRLTDAYRFSELEEGNADQIWNCRKIRLQLLQCKDKLETFMGINMGRFSVPEYNKFRSLPLNEAAITLAESGKIGAVNLLFRRHPYSLSPFILDILSAIPETVPLQTYSQLLPGRSPPSPVALRDPDWVECEKMINFIEDTGVQVRTELILKKSFGFVWPSIAELCKWYKNRARDIDLVSGQLENCLSLLEFASQKGITELKQFHEDIICLFQLIYSDVFDEEMNFTLALAAWEELSDYEKFKMLLKGVKEDTVVGRLMEKAVPFMHSRSGIEKSYQIDSFLVKWLKEIAKENKLEICLVVIEEGFKEFQMDSFFKDEVEAVEIALYCIYSCTLTDQWNTMATILSKLTVRVKSSFSDNNFTPRLGIRVLEPSSSSEAKIHVSNSDSQQDVETLNTAVSVLGDSRTHMDQTNINSSVRSLEKRVKIAEGHVEAGRLLTFYQVPKPMSFFLRAQLDEKDVKQLLRLILSKFGRQPGRLDNDWANMWRDMQSLQESAFPFLDPEYMLTEFCRGLLKAGKFSLSRNYLKGMGSIAFPTEKAETLVIQAAREYFFSASSLACAEIWKAKECLKLFPNSKSVKAEVDVIDVLTLRLPSLGVTLLPMQFRQIRDPMEIIRMVLTSQSGAYLDVEELVDIAKSLGLNSVDDIAAVQEAVAREAALTGDLQQAFDLCLILAKKGHGPIWDLCAAIARGPALDNMDKNSRKKLLGFALSHCDEESIRELLHAWKDLDMQIQCGQLMILTETNPHHIQDAASQGSNADQEIQYKKVIKLLSSVGREPSRIGFSWDNLVQENGKILTFAASELPWLLELSQKSKYGKKWGLSSKIPRKQFMSVRAQAVVCILSWLASNDIAPSDDLVASLAKSMMEPPVTEHEDIFGCSCLLNLVDAYHGVEVIEEQLRSREDYQEICSIMNMGLVYSLLNNSGLECLSPYDRRNMLHNKFLEKHESFSSDERDKIDKLQPTFWTEWKSKLEEKKKLTDQARALEQIMPGAETGRFLSRDLKYIESVVFSFIDSAKVIKRPILKEALKLANTYGLDHTEVLLRYLGSALVSEQWTNDDIQAEILDYKEDLRNCSKSVFDMVSLTVYPLIEGCNKLRLAYIYMILSDCCSLLEGIEEPTLLKHRVAAHTHGLELSLFYKILEQECGKVSFIRTLNFKNIAGLGDLNFEHFNQEVYRNINETSVEALARMVEILVGIYKGSVEGLISWQSVYKNYVQILLTNIETATEMKLQCENHGDFKDFIRELEQCYDSCRIYVRALSSGDIVDIIRRCFKLSLSPLVTLSSEQPCPDSLLLLLNFWIRLVDDIKEILSHKDSEEKQIASDLATLSKCLEVLRKLLMEDGVPANLGLSTASNFVNHGLTKLGLTTTIFDFCNAMVYSGCDFRAVAEVVFEAMEPSLACTGNHISIQNLPRLYENMLCSIMLDLGDGLSQAQSLHNLLSSLRKLEGNLEVLEMVRYAVWGRLIEFSNNMQLPSHIRVYALELMQSLTGKALRGFPDKLLSDVQPWQGWDESQLMTGGKSGEQGELRQSDNFSRFTETLVALKSTQLAAVLSHDIEITPDDLMTVDNAVSCFLRLSLCASSELDFETLEAILEEWDGLFTGQEDKEKSTETPDNGNKWGPNDWDDEGWESFHEELIDKEGKKDGPLSVHPLHACWEVIIKKLIECSYFDRAMKLIDRLLSKLKSVVLTEDEVQSSSQLAAEIDCVMALKIVLLFPYEAIWFQWLGRIEAKLKHRGSPNTIKVDRELSVLILSSGVLSTISSDSAYRSIFSSFCYSMGNLCCLFQEHQLSLLKDRERGSNITEEIEAMLIFSRILLPYFVSELVLAGQFLLAGFIISQFMHTHASLSHINIAEASLKRYLEGHLYGTLSSGEIAMENKGAWNSLTNTVAGLRHKLQNLLQAALLALPASVK